MRSAWSDVRSADWYHPEPRTVSERRTPTTRSEADRQAPQPPSQAAPPPGASRSPAPKIASGPSSGPMPRARRRQCSGRELEDARSAARASIGGSSTGLGSDHGPSTSVDRSVRAAIAHVPAAHFEDPRDPSRPTRQTRAKSNRLGEPHTERSSACNASGSVSPKAGESAGVTGRVLEPAPRR